MSFKTNRGGSWFFGTEICRATYRNAYRPSARNDNYGFRLAASVANIRRVMRGGARYDGAGNCRAAFRIDPLPGLRFDFFGFRLVGRVSK